MKRKAFCAIAFMLMMVLCGCAGSQDSPTIKEIKNLCESYGLSDVKATVSYEDHDHSLSLQCSGFGSLSGEEMFNFFLDLEDIDVFFPGMSTITSDGHKYTMSWGSYGYDKWDFDPSIAGCVICDGLKYYEAPKEDADVKTYDNTDNTPAVSATLGEKNALESAQRYLNVMPFSYTGLIDQLEYEGYTKSEATYGADHCGADWNAQAAASAKSYLALMPFSRQGLIEQLEHDGFTHDQAVYGVEQNGY